MIMTADGHLSKNTHIKSRTIAEKSSLCLSTFRQSIDAISGEGNPQNASIRGCLNDELDRLILWASNMNVFGHANESLDFRLRELPDVSQLFLDQVDIMACRLNQRTRPRPLSENNALT